MLQITILLFIFINFVLLTIIFWLITLIEYYININTDNNVKSDIYECGFITINKNIFPINLNTIILLFFVIIYEIELIFLAPFFINFKFTSNLIVIAMLVIILIIVSTLYFDIWLKKINWIY